MFLFKKILLFWNIAAHLSDDIYVKTVYLSIKLKINHNTGQQT